jgi:hypothetical protein
MILLSVFGKMGRNRISVALFFYRYAANSHHFFVRHSITDNIAGAPHILSVLWPTFQIKKS